MRCSSLLATALVLSAVGCGEEPTGPAGNDGPSLAATSSTESTINDQFAVTRFDPCANGGAGEDVFLSGSFHIVFHVTLDGSGGAHVVEVHNPQGISGVGLTTGTAYQGVGGSPLEIFNVRVGEEHTSVRNQQIVGQGPGNNFVLHEDLHTTVLADGTVTTFHDNFTTECR